MNMLTAFRVLLDPDRNFLAVDVVEQCVLNYGCGNRKRAGEIGVDISVETDADFVVPLETPHLPFQAGTFDLVVSRYVLEHVHDLESIISEIHRVLKPGGRFRFIVPHAFSSDAFDDPTHVRFFTLSTAKYLAGAANIYYAKGKFAHHVAYLRLTLSWPSLKVIRYPLNLALLLIGAAFPKFAEQLLKLPFLCGAVLVELRKDLPTIPG